MLPALVTSFPGVAADFGVSPGTVVPFNRVRLLLGRTDGTAAVDTVLPFSASGDSLLLNLSIKLRPTAPADGEPLQLRMSYINERSDTVFAAGPVTVVAKVVTSTDSSALRPVSVPVHYTGPGARAATVRLSPRSLRVYTNDAFLFGVQTFDAGGTEVLNAPVLFKSMDPGQAALASPSSSAGVAGSTAGRTRIVAGLFGGATDTVELIVSPRAQALQITSGGGQSGNVRSQLSKPVIARVLAADGSGVAGVLVRFAAGQGGQATPSAMASDAEGYVQTFWTLGSSAGNHTLTVTSSGLAGSPFSVSAVAKDTASGNNGNSGNGGSAGSGGLDLNKATMSIESGDGQSARVGMALGAPLVVLVKSAEGKPLPDVKLDWKLGGNDGIVSATTTVTDADGRSTNRWIVGSRAGEYTMAVTLASAGGVGVKFTAKATDIEAQPGKLVFITEPSTVALRQTMQPAVVVQVVDASGAHDKAYAGKVSLALNANAAGVRLTGTTIVSAVAGLAVFDRLVFDAPASGLTLEASSSGFASATSGRFDVTNPPTKLSKVSGDGQQAKPSATLGKDLVVSVDDALGKPMAGVTITWKVMSGDGTLSAATSVTDSRGQASVSWTLGRLTGTQQVAAILDGVTGSPVIFTATAR